MGFVVITPPVDWPVTAAELVEHLRLPTDVEDLSAYLAAATDLVQVETRRQLLSVGLQLHLDRFPCERDIRLPAPPLQSVESITYIDTAGDEQTFSADDYTVDVASVPGRIVLRSAAAWPGTDVVAGAVKVNYTAGYGGAADVPQLLRQCVKMLAGHFYENREATADRTITAVPMAAESIMSRYQVLELP